LWEAILPDTCLGLPAELARVDRLLDAPVFLAPLVAHFDPRIGRPSIPLDTYLRIMFLKFRYQARLRAAVPGGPRFDLLAAVLSHPPGRAGAPSGHAGQAHPPGG